MKVLLIITLISIVGWADEKPLQTSAKNEATVGLQCDTHVQGASCPSKFGTNCPTILDCIPQKTDLKNGKAPAAQK